MNNVHGRFCKTLDTKSFEFFSKTKLLSKTCQKLCIETIFFQSFKWGTYISFYMHFINLYTGFGECE